MSTQVFLKMKFLAFFPIKELILHFPQERHDLKLFNLLIEYIQLLLSLFVGLFQDIANQIF